MVARRVPAVRLAVAWLFAVLTLGPASGAAQQATPAASPAAPPTAVGRLDLAAMALDRADLPTGYRQLQYDDEGYTPGDRVAVIQFGDAAEAEAVAATGIAWFYSSTFQAEDGSGWIYVYLHEYPSEEAAAAGFAYFEDDLPPEGGELRDLPGPAAGEAPKETTVVTYDADGERRAGADATFRVGRVLAGVAVDAVGDAPPDPALVEDLAAELARRVEAVLAGQAPPGIDLGLPRLMLPLFEAWPWPGNSLEGHKGADEFLGSEGPPARFAADYRSGYARFASAGSVPEVMLHTPPYVDVEVAELVSAEAARAVLAVAEELPQRHYGNLVAREPAPGPALPGVNGARAFRTARPPSADPTLDTLDLKGYEIVFALGRRLVVVHVWVEVQDRRVNPAQAEAVALDLATQQADCLRAGGPCGPVRVPAALAAGLAAEATPAAGTPAP